MVRIGTGTPKGRRKTDLILRPDLISRHLPLDCKFPASFRTSFCLDRSAVVKRHS